MGTYSASIATGADDAVSYGLTLYSSGPERIGVRSSNICISGWRFVNVTIPQGATINSATLCLTASASGGLSTTLLKFYGEDEDNPPAWAATTHEPRLATTTTAAVDYDAPAAWVVDTEYALPDLAACVQEIVDRPGWSSGNALCIIGKDDGGTAPNSYIEGYDYSDTPAKAARLVVGYSTVPDPPVLSASQVGSDIVVNWT